MLILPNSIMIILTNFFLATTHMPIEETEAVLEPALEPIDNTAVVKGKLILIFAVCCKL